jgi:hypothetical protein
MIWLTMVGGVLIGAVLAMLLDTFHKTPVKKWLPNLHRPLTYRGAKLYKWKNQARFMGRVWVLEDEADDLLDAAAEGAKERAS